MYIYIYTNLFKYRKTIQLVDGAAKMHGGGMDKRKNIERQRPSVIGMYHQWLLLRVPETVTMYDQHDCPKDIGMRAAHYDHDEPVGLLVWDAKLLFLLSSRSRTCSCKVGQLKASQSDLRECVCVCMCNCPLSIRLFAHLVYLHNKYYIGDI